MGTTSPKRTAPTTLAQNHDPDRAHEQHLADQFLVRQMDRAERGETVGLVEELREAAGSSTVPALVERRCAEILDRRRHDVSFTMIRRLGATWPAQALMDYLLGNAFDRDLERPVPHGGPLPRPKIALRRTDKSRQDAYEPFTLRTGLRQDLSAEESRDLARRWSAADPSTRGPDPLYSHVRIVPDRLTGRFELPPRMALLCIDQHGDTRQRQRARRNGGGDGQPIVEELNASTSYQPVVLAEVPE